MSHLQQIADILRCAGYRPIDRFGTQFIDIEGKRIDVVVGYDDYVPLAFREARPDDAKKVFALEYVQEALDGLDRAQAGDGEMYSEIRRLVRQAALQEGFERYETLKRASRIEYKLRCDCELTGPLVDALEEELGLDEDGLTPDEYEQVKGRYMVLACRADCVVGDDEDKRIWAGLVEEAKERRAGEVVCSGCNSPAVVKVNYPQVSDVWHPMCLECNARDHENHVEVASHEMERHNGAYGVPTRSVRPLK